MPIRSEDYVIQTVGSDLRYLAESWDQEIDDDSLRRSAGVLRILLVDNAYGRAWRAAGFKAEPTLEAIDLERLLSVLNRSLIEYAQAGGARFRGAEISPIIKWSGFMPTDEDARDMHDFLGQKHERVYGLTAYVASPAIFYRGGFVSRGDVIKYIANKLGGTHLDTGRARKRDAVYVLLDDLQSRARLMEKPAAYYELLSIGQTIASSHDAATFLASTGAR